MNKKKKKVMKKHKQTRATTVHLKWQAVVSVCVEVLRPNQPNGVMSSTVSLPNHTFSAQA